MRTCCLLGLLLFVLSCANSTHDEESTPVLRAWSELGAANPRIPPATAQVGEPCSATGRRGCKDSYVDSVTISPRDRRDQLSV
jgi:hypothetical protein